MQIDSLTKMQWLYECGFQPDMYYSCHESGDEDQMYKMESLAPFDQLRLAQDGLLKWEPYFTESALWDLLLWRIEVEEHISAEESFNHEQRDNIIYYDLNIDIDEISYKDDSYNKEICFKIFEIGLHQALLDLVIWTIKEGYLNSISNNKIELFNKQQDSIEVKV